MALKICPECNQVMTFKYSDKRSSPIEWAYACPNDKCKEFAKEYVYKNNLDEKTPALTETVKTIIPTQCWSTERPSVKVCERLDQTKPELFLPWIIGQKIVAMSKEMGNTEWLGYLIGVEESPNNFKVTNIVVPEQEVSGSSVDVIKPVAGDNILGTVHSHHNMGTFFSNTDKSFIGVNHKLMVVYSNNNGYKGAFRATTLCGATMLVDMSVTIIYPNPPRVVWFVEEAKKQIKNKTYVYQTYYGDENVSYGYGYYNNSLPSLFCATCHKQIFVGQSREWIEGFIHHTACSKEKKTWNVNDVSGGV